jgi:phospholipase C
VEHDPADRLGRARWNLRPCAAGSGPAAGPGSPGGRAGLHLRPFWVPWIEPGSVYNDEYRHTSLIATLRTAWGLGDPLTQRDASARTFDHLFTRETPRNPDSWTAVAPQPVPDWAVDYNLVDKALSGLGKTIGPGIIEHAKERGVKNLPPELDDPNVQLTPRLIIQVIRDVAWHYFPKLAPEGEVH